MGGGQASSLFGGAREALGLTHDGLRLAEMEVGGDLDDLYAEAMPEQPSALWDPLGTVEGATESAVERLVRCWIERHGRRTRLDRELILRLYDDFGERTRHDLLLRQIVEPRRHPQVLQDRAWVVRPFRTFMSQLSYMQGWLPAGQPATVEQPDGEQGGTRDAFSGAILKLSARYLPWLYQELPVGHPTRAAAASWAEHIDRRLANPDLLLLAGAVDLSRQQDPELLAAAFDELLAHFQGEPYRSPDERAVAPGLDRGDLVVTWPTDLRNGIFLALRPARLTAPAELEALARELGVHEAFTRHGGVCTCGLRFGQHDVVDVTELRELLVWRSPGLQRIRARLADSPLCEGAYEADPLRTAPDLVAAVGSKLDLGQDAAQLLLQTLALARPSRDHVRRYNGWSLARYRDAGAVLRERGLLVEKTVRATGRDLFLPEEIVELPTRSSPLEASKLRLYGLEPDRNGVLRPPFGMVLPLRPLGEIFVDAWQGSGLGAQGGHRHV